MKTGRTLVGLAEEIQRRAGAKKDLVAKAEAISMELTQETIANDFLFKDVLKDVPEFRTLALPQNRPPASMVAPPHLIDPAPYLPE